jgi:hypothetical protein
MRAIVFPVLLAVFGLVAPDAYAQMSREEIEALRERGQREGWTFTVGETPATRYPDAQAFGLRVPPDWRKGARFDPCTPTRDLPAAFDWCVLGGCTPIKDQLGCGACWAFGLNGAFESQICSRMASPRTSRSSGSSVAADWAVAGASGRVPRRTSISRPGPGTTSAATTARFPGLSSPTSRGTRRAAARTRTSICLRTGCLSVRSGAYPRSRN